MADRNDDNPTAVRNDENMQDNNNPSNTPVEQRTSTSTSAATDNNSNNDNNNNNNHANDDDAASAATATTTNQPIAYEGEEQQYTIKFMFRPKDDKQSTEVARYHFAILQTIAKVYPEVKIFDNRGTKLNRRKIDSLETYSAYLRHYDLHYSKGNKNKNRTPIYMVVHRVLSRIPLSEIRRHFSVDEKLKHSNAKMTKHMWKEDEIRISNLGFFVGYDPSNILPEEMVEIVLKEISRKTRTPEKKIPKFCCNYSSPMLFEPGRQPFSTKAFDLQCRQQDAKSLLQLLHTTYEDNPEFLFHRLRHTSSKQKYINAMIEQNRYLGECQIVPVAGIHSSVMWYLSPKICSMEGVQRVTKHKDSDQIGRYNVHTTREHFDAIKGFLRMNIESLTKQEMRLRNLTPTPFDQPPRVAFKRNIYSDQDEDEDSSASASHAGSYATYMTALDKAYGKVESGLKHDKYVAPPHASGPSTQAWTSAVPIKTVIMQGRSSDMESSQVSQEDYDKMKDERDKLQTRFDELDERFQQYIHDQKEQQERDKKELVDTIMMAMQQQMISFQQNQMPLPPPYYPQGQPPFLPQGQPPFHPPNQAMYPQSQIHGHPTVQQQGYTPGHPQYHQGPAPHQGQTPHASNQVEQISPSQLNMPQTPNQANKRKPNEMSQDGNVTSYGDSKQPATSLDVSMEHGNSTSAADESMANTSVFSHESRS